MDTYQIMTVVLTVISITATAIGAYYAVKQYKLRKVNLSEFSYSKTGIERKKKYDLFISSPLAGFSTDKEISEMKIKIENTVNYFEIKLGLKVFWAGRKINKKSDFDPADISVKVDVKALLESKYFLLIYPQKIVSSVLFEAGIALRECQTSIYLVKRGSNDLPFLMTQAAQVFKNVRTYEVESPEDVLNLIDGHEKTFFFPVFEDFQS